MDKEVYNVKVLADSISPAGCRLTTLEMTYPRFIHQEMLTHRMLSRNSASSRAIPTEEIIKKITSHPVYPLRWGKNCRGMQAKKDLPDDETKMAKYFWREGMTHAIKAAEGMHAMGAHKQVTNRVLEPYMTMKVIVSATEWENFFHLRDSEQAQPEIAWLARATKRAMEESIPYMMHAGDWHTPLISSDPKDALYVDNNALGGVPRGLQAVSAGRCARVSYLTHDGRRDLAKDLKLFDSLVNNGHWSPLEHVAMATETDTSWGNFYGWKQLRKFYEEENYVG